MALARIISHSLECSHQLAASLEDRGYAVEIVSPDAIPGHPADLELRVETSPDNVLTARVQTHHGPRSASLDFVHYLNPPMPDFRHRPFGAIESPPVRPPFIAYSDQPAAVAKDQAARPEEAPKLASLVPEPPFVLAEATPAVPPPSVALSPAPVAVEGAEATRSDQAPEPARSWPRVKIIISRVNPIPQPSSAPRRKPKRIHRPVGWFPRVAATAAALLLAASLLSLGTTRPRAANAVSNRQDSALAAQMRSAQAQIGEAQQGQMQTDQVQTGYEVASLSAHLNWSADALLATPRIDHSVVSAIEADKPKGKGSSSTGSKISAASSVQSATSKPLRRRSHTYRADVVAPNTITYFNSPGAKPTVVKPLPQHPVHTQKHDSVVAGRSVAALNAKAGPKAGSGK